MIAKVVKIYRLDDPQQEIDEQEFWDDQSMEFRIEVLEELRKQTYSELMREQNDSQRFSGFYRIIREKKSQTE